jgi:phage-related protein
MASLEQVNRGYAVAEMQALGQGLDTDEFMKCKVGIAALKSENARFGSGKIVIFEVTAGEKPEVIVHALIKKAAQVADSMALIRREKNISNSSILLPYFLQPVNPNLQTEALAMSDELRVDMGPIGRHRVFPMPITVWVSNSGNKLLR